MDLPVRITNTHVWLGCARKADEVLNQAAARLRQQETVSRNWLEETADNGKEQQPPEKRKKQTWS